MIIRWFTLTASIIFTSYMLDGIQVRGFGNALFAGAVLGILNAFFRPLAIILTLPLNILTLGFFTFVVNAAMLKLASGLIDGFNVFGFWTSIFGALLISIVSWLINSFIGDHGRWEHIEFHYRNRNH